AADAAPLTGGAPQADPRQRRGAERAGRILAPEPLQHAEHAPLSSVLRARPPEAHVRLLPNPSRRTTWTWLAHAASTGLAGSSAAPVHPRIHRRPLPISMRPASRTANKATEPPPTVFLVGNDPRNPREGMADGTSDRGQKKGSPPLSASYCSRQRPPTVR